MKHTSWRTENIVKYSSIMMAIFPVLSVIMSHPFDQLEIQIQFLLPMLVLNLIGLYFYSYFRFYKFAVWLSAPNPVIMMEFALYIEDYCSAISAFQIAAIILIVSFVLSYRAKIHIFIFAWMIYTYGFIRISMVDSIKRQSAVSSLVLGFLFLHILIYCIWKLGDILKVLNEYNTATQKLIQLLPISLITTTLDGATINTCNLMATSIFNIRAGETTNLLRTTFFTNYNDIKNPAIKLTIYNGRKFIYSCFEFSTFPNAITVVAIEITELFNKEESNLRKNMQWLYTNTANHQLRTPLSVIEGMLMLLKEEILTEIGKKHLQVTQISVTNLRHIIDDTIVLKDEKSVTIKSVKFNVDEIISSLRLIFNIESEQKQVPFCINKEGNIPALIGDPEKINHILYTLIQNSFKYTTKGSVTLSISYTDGYLSCSVKDTGIGLTKNDVNSLFKVFSNSEYLRSTEKVGSGIGLYVVNSIVKAMGGVLCFRTKQGLGTEFSFKVKTVPLMHSSFSMSNVRSISISNEEKKSVRILIVDDNSMNIFALKSILEKIGYPCDSAYNGKEATEMQRERKYELILMDINMPVMNGIEATKIISTEAGAQHSEKPPIIVAITAQNEPTSEAEYREMGFRKWITKPVSQKVLKGLFNELLFK